MDVHIQKLNYSNSTTLFEVDSQKIINNKKKKNSGKTSTFVLKTRPHEKILIGRS